MITIDSRMIEISGIGTYIQNIIKYSEDFELFLGNKDTLKKYCQDKSIIHFNSKIYGLSEQLFFPFLKLLFKKKNLLFIPHYNIPIFYPGKLVTTIHDITHLIFPEYLPNKFAYLYAKFMIFCAVKKSKHIFTVSENTKKDLIKMFKVKPKKISVIYNGVDRSFIKKNKNQVSYLLEKYNIPKDKKIILYVGNKKPHKNLERLILAYNNSKNKDHSILLFTGKDFDSYQSLKEVVKEYHLQDHIYHTGVVSSDELVDIYNLADLFVFPSLYEGFGLPPLEAMACGVPVICSNSSSLPEVVGDAALLFNPLDMNELTNGIDQLLTDESLRALYIKKGFEQIKKFSWEEASTKTTSICKTILNKK